MKILKYFSSRNYVFDGCRAHKSSNSLFIEDKHKGIGLSIDPNTVSLTDLKKFFEKCLLASDELLSTERYSKFDEEVIV